MLNLVLSPIRPLHSTFVTVIGGNSDHRSQSACNKAALLCSRPPTVMWPEWESSWTSSDKQTNTWGQFVTMQIHMYWDFRLFLFVLCWVFLCFFFFLCVYVVWPFLSLHAFLFNPLIKVIGKFNVKAYASPHYDLECHISRLRGKICHSSSPAAKENNGGTQKVTIKTKPSNTSRLESWRLLLEVLSERRTA